jgi:hypothetical protein
LGCGPPVAEHKARETAIIPSIMPRVRNEDCTSDPEITDSNVDPFEEPADGDFEIPTPVSCNDVEDTSPSQYQKSMAEQPTDESSEDGEKMESDEQEEMETGVIVVRDAHDKMVQAPLVARGQFLRNFSMSLANSQQH